MPTARPVEGGPAGKVPEATPVFRLVKIAATTRGAVAGDFLDKPLADGGLALDRFAASGALPGVIVLARSTRAWPAPRTG